MEAIYRRVKDGDILKRLSNGLLIVRRIKHEWTPRLEALDADALRRHTDRIRGSKFLVHWTLTRYVEWLEHRLGELGWTDQTSAAQHTIDEEEPVGYSSGRLVCKIRIEISSRCVHAYPVQE